MSKQSVKREILFQDSMNVDKRNENFAYLRKNIYPTKTKGLYPSIDFNSERPDIVVGETIEDILGSNESNYDIKVIVADSGDLKFYNLGSNSERNAQLSNLDYECGVFSNEGVMIAVDDDSIYNVQHANSNTSLIGSFTDARPDIAGFDGLNSWWLSGNEIYKQLNDDAPVVAFNNLGIDPRFVDFLDDRMVIFAEEAGSIVVMFWDKKDLDFFDKRVVIKNAKLISGGVVDGTLMLVKSVGNSSNSSEQEGEIVVTAFDGQKFAKINSIKGGRDDVEYEAETGVGVGNEVMLFSVTRNNNAHNEYLYQNYIYKVMSDGRIEVQTLPDALKGDVHIVRVFQNFSLYANRGGGGISAEIFINEDGGSAYSSYQNFTESCYITPFLTNPYNLHELIGMNIAFEKIFSPTVPDTSGEYLKISYRVSERDDFTLLAEITPEMVRDANANLDLSAEYANNTLSMKTQRYAIVNLPNEKPLPEFNEIQYMFESKHGFSIIGAWHEYNYISRQIFK